MFLLCEAFSRRKMVKIVKIWEKCFSKSPSHELCSVKICCCSSFQVSSLLWICYGRSPEAIFQLRWERGTGGLPSLGAASMGPLLNFGNFRIFVRFQCFCFGLSRLVFACPGKNSPNLQNLGSEVRHQCHIRNISFDTCHWNFVSVDSIVISMA